MPDGFCGKFNETPTNPGHKGFIDTKVLMAHISPSPQLLAAWSLYGPTVIFKEMLTLSKVGRNKAYELKKSDPLFPLGIPLYEGEKSPQFYWTHEVVAWNESRDAKARGKRSTRQ